MFSAVLFVTLMTLLPQCKALYLFLTPADVPGTVPASCKAVLAANITCSELIRPYRPAEGLGITEDEIKTLCVDDCRKSFQTYSANVHRRCEGAILKFNETQPLATDYVDSIQWAFNTSCLINRSTQGFCYPQIVQRKADKCSDCFLQYEAALLSFPDGTNRIDPPTFSSLLSVCSVNGSRYPYQTHTKRPVTVTSTTSSPVAIATCAGKQYRVQNGDSCRSIAKANSLADGNLILENHLDNSCTTLKPGRTICLPQSCKLVEVKANMTCDDILKGQQFFKTQLLSWNPLIHLNCDNLDVMIGQSICISPPGSTDYTVTTRPTPTPPCVTHSPGPRTCHEESKNGARRYGTAIPAPTNYSIPELPTSFSIHTITQTINITAIEVMDAYEQYCPISQDDYLDGFSWEDLPPACEKILDPYCSPNPDAAPSPTSPSFPHVCTPTRTTTEQPTDTGDTKPSPIMPGTVDDCKAFYQVAQSDTCYGISINYNLNLDDFYKWNPGVGKDCTRLLLAYYVCVKA